MLSNLHCKTTHFTPNSGQQTSFKTLRRDFILHFGPTIADRQTSDQPTGVRSWQGAIKFAIEKCWLSTRQTSILSPGLSLSVCRGVPWPVRKNYVLHYQPTGETSNRTIAIANLQDCTPKGKLLVLLSKRTGVIYFRWTPPDFLSVPYGWMEPHGTAQLGSALLAAAVQDAELNWTRHYCGFEFELQMRLGCGWLLS